MNIKKQIRKIGAPITVDYNSIEKKFSVTSNTITCSSSSIKKALKELKKLSKPESTVVSDPDSVIAKKSKIKSDKVS